MMRALAVYILCRLICAAYLCTGMACFYSDKAGAIVLGVMLIACGTAGIGAMEMKIKPNTK